MASRAEWTRRVERWEKSGLSAEAFAAREQLKARQLYWWSWKLRSLQPGASAPPRGSAPVEFVPVHVVDSATPAVDSDSPIEIVLSNGRVVRVRAGVDTALLGRVLSVVSPEEEPC